MPAVPASSLQLHTVPSAQHMWVGQGETEWKGRVAKACQRHVDTIFSWNHLDTLWYLSSLRRPVLRQRSCAVEPLNWNTTKIHNALSCSSIKLEKTRIVHTWILTCFFSSLVLPTSHCPMIVVLRWLRMPPITKGPSQNAYIKSKKKSLRLGWQQCIEGPTDPLGWWPWVQA